MWPDTVSESHHPYRLGDFILESELDHSQKESDLPLEFWGNDWILRSFDTAYRHKMYIHTVYRIHVYMIYMYFMHSKMVLLLYTCSFWKATNLPLICVLWVEDVKRLYSSIAKLRQRVEELQDKARGFQEKWDPYPGSLMIVGNQEKYGNIYMELSQSELIPVGWCKLTQSTPLTQTCDFVYWTQFIPTSWPTWLSVLVLGPGPPRWC